MGSRKVIPFPKQNKSPRIHKGGILQFSAILEEAFRRQPSESDDQKEEDPSEEDDASRQTRNPFAVACQHEQRFVTGKAELKPCEDDLA